MVREALYDRDYCFLLFGPKNILYYGLPWGFFFFSIMIWDDPKIKNFNGNVQYLNNIRINMQQTDPSLNIWRRKNWYIDQGIDKYVTDKLWNEKYNIKQLVKLGWLEVMFILFQ